MSKKLNYKTSFETPSNEVWLGLVEKVLKGKSFEDEMVVKSVDGIDIKVLSTEELFPTGEGASSFQKKEGSWDIRQSVENPNPIEANKEILKDLVGGSTSIHLKLNMGGIVGRRGIKITCQEDMETLLENVYIEHIKLSIEAASDFADATATLLSSYIERGVNQDNVNVSLCVDPLATLMQYGKLPNDIAVILGEMGVLAKHMHDDWPNVRSVGVDTRVYNLSGSTALQEVSFSIATGIQYLRIMEKMGLSAEEAASQITFLISVDCEVFMTIAKIRALRNVWGRCLKACGVEDVKMHIHAETSERMLTKRDPWNNILRTTTAGLGAALGGADSISVLPFTQALGGADERGRRIARNIQIILSEESNLSKVGDPAAGSWAIEDMTNSLSEKAWEMMKGIESVGGMPNAVQDGLIEQAITAKADIRNQEFEDGNKHIIGVTSFFNEGETPVSIPLNGWKPLNYKDGLFQQRLAGAIDEIPEAGEKK